MELTQKRVAALTLDRIKSQGVEEAIERIDNQILEAANKGLWETRVNFDNSELNQRSYLVNHYRSLGFKVEPFYSEFHEVELLDISWRFQ